jgi:hypothetical protein
MQLITQYHAGIDWIVRESGQNDKFVHVQVGLIVWLLSAALLGQRLGRVLPLVLVILAEVGNELMDRLYLGRWNWPDTIGDAVATWAWPAVLTAVLAIDRARRGLSAGTQRAGSAQLLPMGERA